MFEFLKRKKKELSAETTNSGGVSSVDFSPATTIAAVSSSQASTRSAAQRFAKPQDYTGSRTLYDSGPAKHQAKISLFSSSAQVRDPYTGQILTLTKAEAKRLYGSGWQQHLAEADHIHPLERIHQDHKSDPFLTNDDIRSAANSSGNLEVTSRAFNNAKRSRTNEEFMSEREYREARGLELSETSEREAVMRGRKAQESVDRQLRAASAKNALSTFHEAGLQGAYNAGGTALTMSGIVNITAVIKGEKTAEQAITDTVKTGGAGAVTGYVVSGGLTTLSQALSGSSSQFMKALAKSNVPGQVVTAVMTFGGTVKRFASGEINTGEFLREIGGKGADLFGGGYGLAVGQALIPIPIVGGAIGALAGSLMTGELYNGLIRQLQEGDLESAERKRIIAECQEAVKQEKAYRAELEAYLHGWFREYRACFDDALSQMKFAFTQEDADGIIAAANKITRKLGGQVKYENVREFREFLAEDSVDRF